MDQRGVELSGRGVIVRFLQGGGAPDKDVPLISPDECGRKINEQRFNALIHYCSQEPVVLLLLKHHSWCLRSEIYVIEDVEAEKNGQH